MKLISSFLLFVLFMPHLSYSGEVKVRAREHFEILEIKQNSNKAKYQGFTNTINIFWEKPYDFSIGLSYSPILSNFKEKEDNSFLGKKVKTIHFGLEAKIFETDLFNNFFVRPGISYTILKTKQKTENSGGLSTYLGLGYELPIKYFGLAFEVAYRFSHLENNYTIDTISPSIGLHFYRNL